MIHKSVNYFNAENVTFLEFGKGTIGVYSAFSEADKEAYVFFRTKEAGVIGEFTGEDIIGKRSDDLQPEVMMGFKSVESIDVLIDYLNECKENLQNILTPLLNSDKNVQASVATDDTQRTKS